MPKNTPPITDKPTVIFLSAVVAAFVAGATTLIFVTKHIEEKARAAVTELKNNGELPPGPPGPIGPVGPEGPTFPVGSIVAFWGAREDIPAGYEICDGELVTTPDSPIREKRKPDLRDSFVKGALPDVTDVTMKPEIGITHTKDISHSHPAGDLRAMIGMHGRPGGFISMVPRGGQFGTEFEFAANGATRSGGAPDFGVAVDGNTASTPLSVDVRPKFVSTFIIIKVK